PEPKETLTEVRLISLRADGENDAAVLHGSGDDASIEREQRHVLAALDIGRLHIGDRLRDRREHVQVAGDIEDEDSTWLFRQQAQDYPKGRATLLPLAHWITPPPSAPVACGLCYPK